MPPDPDQVTALRLDALRSSDSLYKVNMNTK
ncbi:hypothetical protein RO3G_15586 [Rhizopus delemar RA 99-880]|uniref:Uncharacterized protein n=1 Tax=Rhizopus delemar (strain RA 99-880 / ATCC MYA-4621 / FGSC 9543 / NRRL 43880) TaxID=246409 RepID=I1CQZ5_RHIO9|nr:hypothetical protein RO3G_15586 [Rhizopus delemar RA 99-880]|eukprot:EIE90875.1 hypothetical protein RO3G_15586 [Rhizopus delemar RA 99-880]